MDQLYNRLGPGEIPRATLAGYPVNGLGAAAIGAVFGLGTSFATSFLQFHFEAQKREWTQSDQRDAKQRAAVQELSTKIAAGSHYIVWLAWWAQLAPDRITRASLDNYDAEMRKLQAEIIGSISALRLIDQDTGDRMYPLVEKMMALDAQMSSHGLLIERDRDKAIGQIGLLYEHATLLTREVASNAWQKN